MAYYGQTKPVMPYERSLLMPFSVRHFSEDDKLCHHTNLDVLQEIYPLKPRHNPGNKYVQYCLQ